MIDTLVIHLHDIVFMAGFWGIVLFAFAQEIIPPIPSTIFAITLGFALFAGASFSLSTLISIITTIGIPIALGLTVGAIIIYGVFYWGGRPLLERYGRYIGVSWSDIEQLRERFHDTNKDELLLFIARAFPLVPSVALNVFAGIVRWPLKSFVVLTFSGTIIRGFLGAIIGWQTGGAFIRYAQILEQINTWVFGGIVVALIGFVGYRYVRRQSDKSIWQ